MEEAKKDLIFYSQLLVYGLVFLLLSAYGGDNISEFLKGISGVLGFTLFMLQIVISLYIVMK